MNYQTINTQRQQQQRGAFTLAEILISIMIFMMLSGAMFGIFLSVTQLYSEGEFSRSANDSAQIVINLLERDITRAVPAISGGVFYAWLDKHSSDPNASSGNCVVGWVIRNQHQSVDYPNPFVFVLWGVTHDVEEPLRRRVFDISGDLSKLQIYNLAWTDMGADPDDDSDDTTIAFDPDSPLASLSTNSEGANTITQGCLHFSASLTGTAHDISGAYTVCKKPSLNSGASNPLAKTTYWSFITDGVIASSDEPFSEPSAPGIAFSSQQTLTIDTINYPQKYPNAIRCSLVLSSNERFKKEGRLQADLDAAVLDNFQVTGIDHLASTPGSLIRIGDSPDTYEWIGYYDYTQDGLLINTDWEHGPCMPIGAGSDISGRGVLKSTPKSHSVGDIVRVGRLLTLTRTMPQ